MDGNLFCAIWMVQDMTTALDELFSVNCYHRASLYISDFCNRMSYLGELLQIRTEEVL